MSPNETNKPKYSFDTDLQQEILQFTVTDIKLGFKALELFEADNFTLISHNVIAEALKRYYKRKSIVPSQALLKEEVRKILRTKQWQNLILPGDRESVFKIIRKIYARPVKDASEIYQHCKAFAQYSKFRDVVENIDMNDVESFKRYVDDMQKAISIGNNFTDSKGVFILADARARILRRSDAPQGDPTPYWQLNQAMNAGGTTKGNVIAMFAPAKRFKTGVLLNTARGYLKRGKVVLYVDMENGEEALATRMDQGIINSDRKTLISGEIDDKFLKMARKYKRFGGEIIIKRFPAGSTTADFARYNKMIRDEFNLQVTHAIVDYPDVMGDSKNTQDEVRRISQVYIDLKNWADEDDIECIWCPSHVNREGDNKQGKKFKATDVAKAMDKVRHADLILGLNQNDTEKEAGVIRMEIIDQRDGLQDATIWLWGDLAKQRVKEFNKAQVAEWEAARKEGEDGSGHMIMVDEKKRNKVSDL